MSTDEQVYQEIHATFLKQRLIRTGKTLLFLATLAALFYASLYAYARIKIYQAKQLGVYPTLEEAVNGFNIEEYRGAKVVRFDINHMEPCFPGGKHPFIWCVSTTTFFDQAPEGSRHTIWRGGYTPYYHLPEGWVFMSEMIPGSVGTVMEMFRMKVGGP